MLAVTGWLRRSFVRALIMLMIVVGFCSASSGSSGDAASLARPSAIEIERPSHRIVCGNNPVNLVDPFGLWDNVAAAPEDTGPGLWEWFKSLPDRAAKKVDEWLDDTDAAVEGAKADPGAAAGIVAEEVAKAALEEFPVTDVAVSAYDIATSDSPGTEAAWQAGGLLPGTDLVNRLRKMIERLTELKKLKRAAKGCTAKLDDEIRELDEKVRAGEDALRDIAADGPPEITRGDYSDVPGPRNPGEGRDFTRATKRDVLEENRQRNGGTLRSDRSGVELKPGTQSRRGVRPDPLEAQVDHKVPRSRGGTNDSSNAQVLSREENQSKGNRYSD